MSFRPGNKFGFIHGGFRTGAHRSWRAMKNRCLNKNNKDWPYYGGGGIKICDRWLDFNNFLKDMGERPPGLSLDRIDNCGNYEPKNCKWSSVRDQRRNRRTAVLIEHNGQTKNQQDWARDLGLDISTIQRRRKRGITNSSELLAIRPNRGETRNDRTKR